MKITFILTDFPAYSQTFIEQQIKNLIDDGHEISILANNNPNQKIHQPVYKKYQLARITTYFTDNIYEENPQLNELKKFLDLNTDLFHCHFFPTGVALVKLFEKISQNKPILISSYGADVMTQTIKNKYQFMNRPNVSFVAVSESIKRKLVYLGIKPEKIWILPLTADLNFFKKINKKKNKITRFVSVCRFVEKKGLDSAIKAFGFLFKNYPALRFQYDIYGDGPLINDLTYLVSKNKLNQFIKIHPPITHYQIKNIFKKADFLIHTSKTAKNGDSEGLPTVILEAESYGLPIIATYHSGIPEEVIHNKTGLLTDESNLSGIALNIMKAIEMSNKTYEKFSNSANRLVKNKFSNDIIKKKTLDLYGNLIKHSIMKNNNQKKESDIANLNRKRPIKILFFSHSSNLTGSERSLLELVDELLKKNVLITVILPSDGPLKKLLDKSLVTTVIIPFTWWTKPDSFNSDDILKVNSESQFNLLSALPKLKEINPDVIYTNTVSIPWGAITAILLGKPHIWHIREFGKIDHNLHFDVGETETKKFINATSNAVITNSYAIKNYYKDNIDEKKMTVVYNYINIPKDLLRQKPKQKIFKSKTSIKLLILGTIMPGKGQKDALFAAKILKDKKYNFELAIVGHIADSKYAQEIKDFISNNNLEKYVHFGNFLDNPYPLINSADIVLTCSVNEAFGRGTVEAMLLKKAVIGTKSGGTVELIKENYNGLLYKPGDFKELVKKIEYLIVNKNKLKVFGNNAFKFVKKNITKNGYGGKIFNLIKKVTRDKPPFQEYDPIKISLSNTILRYVLETKLENEKIKALEDEIEIKKSDLNKFFKSKTYKIWQFYCKIKKSFS